MIGLERGTVKLESHQKEWDENAKNIMKILKQILGENAIDIQHIGSTSIFSIHAKPIIDIVVGMHKIEDILPYTELLKRYNIIFHGEIIDGEILFIIGDEMRTHHIHIVKWDGVEWNNYINFRDYLNANFEKAILYDTYKQKLAKQFPNNRKSYTMGKEKIIESLLLEARIWKLKLK